MERDRERLSQPEPSGRRRGASVERRGRRASRRRARTRWTTRPPAQASRNPKKAALPHCAGETQASPGREHRRHDAEVRRVEDVLAAPAQQELARRPRRPRRATARSAELVRRSRQRDSPEISALLGSNAGSRADARAGELGREGRREEQGNARQGDVEPQRREAVERSADSAPIWYRRGSRGVGRRPAVVGIVRAALMPRKDTGGSGTVPATGGLQSGQKPAEQSELRRIVPESADHPPARVRRGGAMVRPSDVVLRAVGHARPHLPGVARADARRHRASATSRGSARCSRDSSSST